MITLFVAVLLASLVNFTAHQRPHGRIILPTSRVECLEGCEATSGIEECRVKCPVEVVNQ